MKRRTKAAQELHDADAAQMRLYLKKPTAPLTKGEVHRWSLSAERRRWMQSAERLALVAAAFEDIIKGRGPFVDLL